VKSYVPPDPAKIQAAKDAGKVTIDVLEPGKRASISFRDYQKAGDKLTVEIDRVLAVTVSTYLDSATDVVTLNARMGQLNDSTSYTSGITLNSQAKKLTVTVQNTGYRMQMWSQVQLPRVCGELPLGSEWQLVEASTVRLPSVFGKIDGSSR